ncbi:hypothetical protein VTN77DRAFT_9134 [Rasamsonia byssochlamydoides]|uniref:uncharacterized protein n=1 Tax=Rasamsonia byssochlamydoides TaxID=89139 RepID=UPI003743DBFD
MAMIGMVPNSGFARIALAASSPPRTVRQSFIGVEIAQAHLEMQPIFNGIFLLLGLTLTIPQVLAQFISAPVANGSLPITYTATLFDKSTTGIRGTISGTGGPGGIGTTFVIDFTGFPDESIYGPFEYHIHVDRVPPDGNCTAALGHLDTTNRGEEPPCNANEPATCQIGDLSGKHGLIVAEDGEPWIEEYIDYYLSTTPGNPAFIGDRSVVVHSNNGTRLNCGNFELVSSPAGAAPNAATKTASVTATTVTVTPSPAPFHAAAPRARELSGALYLAVGVVSVALWAFCLM